MSSAWYKLNQSVFVQYSPFPTPQLTDVAQFLQGVMLLSAMAFSPYPLLRITKQGDAVSLV